MGKTKAIAKVRGKQTNCKSFQSMLDGERCLDCFTAGAAVDTGAAMIGHLGHLATGPSHMLWIWGHPATAGAVSFFAAFAAEQFIPDPDNARIKTLQAASK